jgi:hypothetical protein
MFLVRLIYASTVNDHLTPADYQSILASSIKNNSEADITGMLACDGRYFLQCLEGSRTAVNRTYSRILNDSRHSNVLLLSYGEISARHFCDWAMGYVALSSEAQADIKPDVLLRLVGDAAEAEKAKPRAVSLPFARAEFLKYSIKREFDPYALSDSGSLALLQGLATLFAS